MRARGWDALGAAGRFEAFFLLLTREYDRT
jgi:hypothetical protein